jgi:predicted phage tail protein
MIHLHGALKRCGGPYRLDVATAGEAVRALALQVPGFAAAVKARDPRRLRRLAGWRVIRGDRRAGLALGPEALAMNLGRAEELHIVPVVAGADSRGLGTAEVIAGITLLALAAIAPVLAPVGAGAITIAGVPVGTVALTGLALGLSGAETLSTAQPNATNDRSFLLHGDTNAATEGDCVPVCAGRFRYPPKLISAGLTSFQVPVGYVPPQGTGVNGGPSPWAHGGA